MVKRNLRGMFTNLEVLFAVSSRVDKQRVRLNSWSNNYFEPSRSASLWSPTKSSYQPSLQLPQLSRPMTSHTSSYLSYSLSLPPIFSSWYLCTHINPLLSCPWHVHSIFCLLSLLSYLLTAPLFPICLRPNQHLFAGFHIALLDLPSLIIHWQVLLLNQLPQSLKSAVQHQLERVRCLWISQLADPKRTTPVFSFVTLAIFSLKFVSIRWHQVAVGPSIWPRLDHLAEAYPSLA